MIFHVLCSIYIIDVANVVFVLSAKNTTERIQGKKVKSRIKSILVKQDQHAKAGVRSPIAHRTTFNLLCRISQYITNTALTRLLHVCSRDLAWSTLVKACLSHLHSNKNLRFFSGNLVFLLCFCLLYLLNVFHERLCC